MLNENNKQELLEKQLAQLKEENTNLLESKTLSFIVGDLVLKSRKSPFNILKLPFQLMKIRKQYLNGEIRPKYNGSFLIEKTQMYIAQDCILFMATNGVGLGHLTRCLAVARRIKNTLNKKQIIFLTTCPALHLIRNEGFLPFYVPSKEMFEGEITSTQWDNLLLSAFRDIFSLYSFDTIIFDGAIPYQSLCFVLEENKDILKIWIRRGSAKKTAQNSREKSEELFDYIFVPEEFGNPINPPEGKFRYVEPIVYLDNTEQLSKDMVRKYFGVTQNQRLIYVQLGAGKINNTEITLERIIKILLKDENNVIVLGQSALGEELDFIDERIIVIKDYPNAKYFNGFDLAVSACGYNSFHELMYSKVPAIFLPNSNTGTDDQVARAKRSEASHMGIVLTNPDEKQLSDAVNYFINNEKELAEKKNGFGLLFSGSKQAAQEILELRKQKK